MGDSELPGVRRIVAAVDMTVTGDHALREAMRMTRDLRSSELHAVYVIDVDPKMHDAAKIARLADQIEEAAGRLRERVLTICAPQSEAQSYERETVMHIRLGRPAEAIHQLCVDVNADLAVVGTHQRKGLEKLLLGSVAATLVERARLPVLVAHPRDFSGLDRSSTAEAARPGAEPEDRGATRREVLSFRPRGSHISGLA